jgi:hypothetical protein
MTANLTEMGVYPFVVPFVPIQGTALEHHSKPEQAFMQALYPKIGEQLRLHGLTRKTLKRVVPNVEHVLH